MSAASALALLAAYRAQIPEYRAARRTPPLPLALPVHRRASLRNRCDERCAGGSPMGLDFDRALVPR